ncbi:MAG: alpha-ketoacid dehydrogenase subunit beta [Acidimicrobiia bacterium]
MTVLKFWQAVNAALDEELSADPSVVLFGEDVGRPGGPFGASRGLQERHGAARVRDTPIAEGAITGIAVGAAMCGLRPVVEIMYFDFITLAMDQLVNQAAKMRYMSGGTLTVPMTMLTFCGAGRGSGPQHSQSLEAWLANVPGLTVVYPSNPADAKALLKASIQSADPVVFIESSRLWTVRGELPDGDHRAAIGQASIPRPGSDVTIVSWGWALTRCLAAAELLAAEGIEAEVVDLRTIMPLDANAVLSSVARTGHVVIVHDAAGPYGPGAEISATIAEHGFGHLRAPIVRVTAPFAPAPFATRLEHAFYPADARIAAAAAELLGHRIGAAVPNPGRHIDVKEKTAT